MKLVEHITGKDYNVLVLDDVIRDTEKYDINSWFNEQLYLQDFAFPAHHSDFVLRQFESCSDVKLVGEQVKEDLKEFIDIPENTYVSSGTHQIHYSSNNKMGAVPPHTDFNHFCGITIFVNKIWKPTWGGWNVCLSEEEVVRTTTPKFNRAVVVMNSTTHCAVPLYLDKVRRTVQLFITYDI